MSKCTGHNKTAQHSPSQLMYLVVKNH